jgi:threonine/homoserine/homoserine lactone efflux protein
LFTGLIYGFILGYLLSMPPMGPTNFAIIAKGFKKDINAGIAIGTGAGFMDFVYILVAFGGVSVILSFVPQSIEIFFSQNEKWLKFIFSVLGCSIVIIYGIKIMRTKIIEENPDEPITPEEIEEVKEIADEKLLKTKTEIKKIFHRNSLKKNNSSITGGFFTGVLLCLSSVTLPASWFAIVSILKGYGIIDANFFAGFGLAIGVLLGTVAWFYTLVKFISKNSEKIKPATLYKINISVGIILLALGAFLIYQVFYFAFAK